MAGMIQVLLIDDDLVSLELGKVFLEKSGDILVTGLDTASEALGLLEKRSFDAVVTDYRMSGMDGISFLKQLRARRDETPCIIFTGLGHERLVIEAMNHGADFYVQKSVDTEAQFNELESKIRKAVRQRQNELYRIQSEEKFTTLFRSSPSLETVTDLRTGKLVDVNETFLMTTGYSRDDAIGKTARELSHLIRGEDLDGVMEEIIEKGTIRHRQSVMITKTGQVRTLDYSAQMIRIGDSELLYTQAVDITEQQKAIEALRIQHDLSLALNSCTNLHEALIEVLSAALQIEGLDAGGIYLADPLTGSVEMVAHHGLSPVFVEKTSHYDASSFQVLESMKGVPFYSGSDEHQWILDPSLLEHEQIGAIASIPVIHDKELISVLNVGSHTADEIPVTTRRTLETLAVQVASVLVRIRSQQALVESENRYRHVVEDQTELVCRFLPGGTLMFVNEAFCRYFARSREDLVGHRFLPGLLPPDQQRVRDTLEALDRDHPESVVELTLTLPDGSSRWQRWSYRAITDDTGMVKEYQSVGQDITDRKQAESELEETRQRLEDIINFLPDATFAIDTNGRVIAWNRAIEEMTGVRAADMLGKGNYEYALPFYRCRRPILIDLVMLEDARILRKYDAVQRDGDALTAETDRARIGDRDRYLWGKAIVFKNSKGEVVGAIESIRDISSRKKVEKALEQSRNLYRAIFETTGAATIIIGEDTTVLLANSGFARLSGFEISAIEGKKSWTEFVHPDELEWMRTFHHRRRDTESGTPEVYRFRFVDRDRGIHYCLNNVGLIPGTKQSVASVVDITDVKQAEETLLQALMQLTRNEQELRESEEKYRTVFENTGTATVVINEDRVIELANNGFVELSGYPKEEIEGKKSWTEFVVSEDLDLMKTQHQLRRQEREKALTQYEFRFVTKTGLTKYIYLFIDVIPGTQKSIASLLDITARKEAEEMYQTIFENTGTAMVIVEEDSVISHMNEKMEGILGYSHEEIEGRMSWHDLVCPDDIPRMREYHRTRWQEPGSLPSDYEFRFIHKNGETRDASLTVAIIPGTKRSVVSLRDITGIKVLDRKVRERSEQIEQLLRQKDEFIAQAGHDLKTPLTPIVALLPHIYEKEKDPDLRELLEIVISDAATMKNLIADILTLAELNTPHYTPKTTDMTLFLEVAKICKKFAWIAEKQGNYFDNRIDPETRITMASIHLDSILNNLIGNAVRYSPGGGMITIGSSVSSGTLTFFVSDPGIGLDPEETKKVFNEFYKADSSRHHRDSSGLGLSIVKRIVHLYGGAIDAWSQGPGTGSTFTVRLPLQVS